MNIVKDHFGAIPRVMTSNTLKVDNSSHCTTPSDRADHQVVSVKVGCFHINPANA
ncbi:hypothetical protein JYU34_005616 [Plutella xylostella]|uniref:Uncharacterized protein n=1 Tax=Plutella xylostella TaxID=51655 RepID=A0ABQ7QTP1_PLUXY|nr:hypothetical protein JYU34_005616 [Plutella xylostella]